MTESDSSKLPTFASGFGDDRNGMAAALIARMAKQDGSALTELYEMWSPTLLGIACRMLGDRREAEEAVQDTFVRMWHRSADYDSKQSPPFVWAFGVMRGYCIDRLRYRHREKRDSSRVVPIHLHNPPDEIEDPRVMAIDDWRRIRDALKLLDEKERNCLELAIFLEYTHSEISKHLSTPLGTVKNRLRRALDKVRNHLSRHEF
ncbi:MAG: RNA polymerase sigma factor [Akkermansiaceae bacterium]|nr:RNA polymerase sigma factor [Akkermansiaceae bacterium]